MTYVVSGLPIRSSEVTSTRVSVAQLKSRKENIEKRFKFGKRQQKVSSAGIIQGLFINNAAEKRSRASAAKCKKKNARERRDFWAIGQPSVLLGERKIGELCTGWRPVDAMKGF